MRIDKFKCEIEYEMGNKIYYNGKKYRLKIVDYYIGEKFIWYRIFEGKMNII